MPFEIPKHFDTATRSMIETALEKAWRELSKGTRVEAMPTKEDWLERWWPLPPLVRPTS